MIEVYNEYKDLGVATRKITLGKECELVTEFINFIKGTYTPSEDKNMAIFLETKVNNSYPDIVLVEYCPSNFDSWQDVRNSLAMQELKILYHIYMMGGVDASEIVSQLGTTWKKTMISIEKLYDSRLIMRRCGRWRIRNRKSISPNKIKAIEAKIDKIDVVVRQALVNKSFASESYILSNKDAGFFQGKMARFDNLGIGVYAKRDDGFEVVRKSDEAPIPVNFNSIYFNELVGRILNHGMGVEKTAVHRSN